MADLNTIVIKADTSDLKSAQRDLKNLGDSSKQMGRTFESSGKRAANSLNGVRSQAIQLHRVLAVAGIVKFSSELTKYADTWTSVSNKIRQVTNTSAAFAAAQGDVFKIANDTRSSLEATATLYSRTARRADELGISTAEVGKFTRAVNQSLQAYGATAREAEAATLQLSQALGKGVLNGDEFRTISESAPPLLKAIALSSGVAEGKLKDLGAQGLLTAKMVVDGVLQSADTFENDFGKAVATYASKLNVARNNTSKFVGESEALNAIVDELGDSIISLSENLGTVTNVALVGASVGAAHLGKALTGLAATKLANVNATHMEAVASSAALEIDAIRAKQSVATAKAMQVKTAAEVQSWKSVVTSTQNEIKLEAVRLKSQISAKGRLASVARLVAARAELTAATTALSAAEARLAATQSATATAAKKAALSTVAYSAATRNATLASVAFGAATKGATAALALVGGPAGALVLAGIGMAVLAKNAREAKNEIHGLSDATMRFHEIEALQAGNTVKKRDRTDAASRLQALEEQIRGAQRTMLQATSIEQFDETSAHLDGFIAQLKDLVKVYPHLASEAAKYYGLERQSAGFSEQIVLTISALEAEDRAYRNGGVALEQYLEQKERTALLNKLGADATEAELKELEKWITKVQEAKKIEEARSKANKKPKKELMSLAAFANQIEAHKKAYADGAEAVASYDRAQRINAETARLVKNEVAGEADEIRALIVVREDAMDAYEAQLERKKKADAEAKEFQALKDELDPATALDTSHQAALDLINKQVIAEEEKSRLIGLQNKLYLEQKAELAGLNKEQEKFSIDDMTSSIAGSIKSFQSLQDEGTDAYKNLGAAAQVFEQITVVAAIAREMAEARALQAKLAAFAVEAQAAGTTAVVEQGTGGDPYTAFARMAAMAAAVAALGVSIGGAFSSGSDQGYDLEAKQKAQGTGSVLGDAAAKSESIANAIEAMEKNSDIEVGISQSMLRQLQMLNQNISGLGTILARQFGDFTLNDPNTAQFDKGNVFTDANDAVQGVLSKVIDMGSVFDLFGIGGMLNDLAGDILGSVLGGLFGKTSASVVDSGLAIASQNLGELMADGLAGASLDAMQFATIQIKKKSWFSSSTSYQRQTDELGGDVTRQLGLIVGGLYEAVLTGANAAFGVDATNQLNQLNLEAVDISLRGLSGDERTEALQAVFGKIGDQMAGVVPRLSEFQQAGEGLFETLGRVASDVVRAEYQLEQFGLTMGDVYSVIGEADVALELIRDALVANAGAAGELIDNFGGTEEELLSFADRIFDLQTTFGLIGMSVESLTEQMIRGARGSDSLASGVAAYVEGFLSEDEQLSVQRGQLRAELANSGIDLPATRQAYRAMLEGLDTTTSEGQRLAGALLASADAADSLFTSIEDAAQAQIDAQLEVVASLRALAKTAQEVYEPSSLSSLQQSFFATANKARAGDLGSAESLVGIGHSVLSAASNEARSKYEYERIAATVAGTANSIANMFDIPTEVELLTQQLMVLEEIRDGSPAFYENSEGEASRVDVIETKLAELAEELRSGFFAVAKNTQKTAKLLDRWDGDGMPEERVA